MVKAKICFLLTIHLLILSCLTMNLSAVDASGGNHQRLSWVPTRARCGGSVAECMGDDDDEFNMDTEINRRILATTQYISYGALQRNTVPCSQRGASYYNCQVGGAANPYSRGCSAISRCRS